MGKRKCVIYTRVASQSQEDQEIASDWQSIVLKKLAKKLGLVASEVYSDYGYSGHLLNRPMFNKLMARISKQEIGVVLCVNLDRLSRDVATKEMILHIFEQNGVDIITP